MQNPSSNVRDEVEKVRIKLDLLQELELLESEFRLIENEYTQRKRHLASRLSALEGNPTEAAMRI